MGKAVPVQRPWVEDFTAVMTKKVTNNWADFGLCCVVPVVVGPGRIRKQLPSTRFEPSFLEFNAARLRVCFEHFLVPTVVGGRNSSKRPALHFEPEVIGAWRDKRSLSAATRPKVLRAAYAQRAEHMVPLVHSQ